MLGQYLNILASENFKILTTYNQNVGNCRSYSSAKTDIRNNDHLKLLFRDFKPGIVIHTAAITNAQPRAEQSAKDYFETNVRATKYIAELCREFNSKIIYVSTDLVYAGYRGSFLKEEAKLIPASLYAETKLMGEMKIRETTENYLIVRVALLYGIGLNHSRCHFQFMYDNLRNNKPAELFTDQFRTPVSLRDAAKIITELAKSDLKNEIINLGGSERLSRYELGEVLCSVAGFDKNLIQKIRMEDIPGLPKVEDVSLSIGKLLALGLKPGKVEENIRLIIAGKSQ